MIIIFKGATARSKADSYQEQRLVAPVYYSDERSESSLLCLLVVDCTLVPEGPCSWRMLNFLWHLQFIDAIKPVLNGAILSSHPVLSDQLSKSQMCFSLLTVIFTSIKWLQSPFTKSQQPVFIVLHPYWTVTESGTTQMKLRIIFQVIINPCFFLKINVFNSIFEGDFVHLVVK